jgi:hypothetical protein
MAWNRAAAERAPPRTGLADIRPESALATSDPAALEVASSFPVTLTVALAASLPVAPVEVDALSEVDALGTGTVG